MEFSALDLSNLRAEFLKNITENYRRSLISRLLQNLPYRAILKFKPKLFPYDPIGYSKKNSS